MGKGSLLKKNHDYRELVPIRYQVEGGKKITTKFRICGREIDIYFYSTGVL